MRRLLVTALAVLGMTAAAQPLAAQDYPARPVRVVVPFAAGAGTDLLGRIVAQELSKYLGQQFVVENKPGAAAQVGTDTVAKAAPDGYTLLWTVSDGLSVLPAVKSTIPYRIPEDFIFIAGVAQTPFAVTVNPKVPAKSFAELVAHAKANPDKLNFGSAGVGSAPHMGIELMNGAAGMKMVHVPFNGLGPTTNALIAGTVDVAFLSPQPIKGHVESGALRILATTGTKRFAGLPDVQTLREQGLNVTTIVGYGLSAPAGTPEPIVTRLKQAVQKALEDKAVAERLRGLGYETDLQLGDAYKDFIVKDLGQWRDVAKAANIKID
jgi:tripartite-type tricarboxylate transporter receptor subunit TctC